VLGFAIALLLANEDLWGKTFFRSVLMLPYVISDMVVGTSFRVMFHPILGVVNYVLGTRGTDWFGAPDLALFSITLAVDQQQAWRPQQEAIQAVRMTLTLRERSLASSKASGA